jgi:hypothetical protein
MAGVNNQGIGSSKLSWPAVNTYTFETWAAIAPVVSAGYDSLFVLKISNASPAYQGQKVGIYSSKIPAYAGKVGKLGWGWEASVDTASKWNDGKFHHFAFVQDDGERRIYVDGKLDATAPVTYPLAAASSEVSGMSSLQFSMSQPTPSCPVENM